MRDLLSDLNNYTLIRILTICVRSGKWCQRFLWHKLTFASCEFYV